MLLSIVIPTYNSEKYIEKSLQSIFSQDIKDCEVITVDNGSDDGTAETIENIFSSVILIKEKENKGASYARNRGLDEAKGKWIMFMDCDVELEAGFIKTLKNIIANNPSIPAIAPEIIDINTSKIMSCGLYISLIGRVYDVNKGKDPSCCKVKRIHGPSTCCGIVQRKYLEKIKDRNYFDEDFFFLFEDADMAWKMKRKRYRCYVFPELVCYHKGNSSNTTPDMRRFLCVRNRFYMIFNNCRGWRLFLFFLISFVYDIPRTLHFFLTSRYRMELLKGLQQKYRDSGGKI
ncbi:MAG: glycosyltransferase [Candidatus Omnitrophica bacterium]|nr:glycosyltransferase [Candidatus Omnitrophota bacterium]MBD3268573.1 glycosyltransferase [Candidatus Omnitrophota bacterium]